jgi:hypothetical protein
MIWQTLVRFIACINSEISSGRIGIPTSEPMPRTNPRNSARKFRLMLNQSSVALGAECDSLRYRAEPVAPLTV